MRRIGGQKGKERDGVIIFSFQNKNNILKE